MPAYMNLASSSFAPLPLTFVTILLFFALQYIKRRKINRNSFASKRTPPGETGLPWIGETMEWYRAQTKNRIFEDFIRPRVEKHGPTFKTRLMGAHTVIVNGAEANRFFLSNEFKLVVSSWPTSSVQLMGKNSIMEKTGDHHRFIRGIIAPCLGTGGIEPLLPKICEVVKIHLAKYWGIINDQQEEKTIGLYRSAKLLTFTIMCECLLEIDADEGLFECFEKVLEGVFSPAVSIPGTRFWRARRARSEIERVLVNVVRKKKEEMTKSGSYEGGEGTSLLSKLVGGLIRGDITEDEVVDNVVLLIFAAHDTTSFAIAMTFKMLAQHPDCYSLLLQEHMDIKRGSENLRMEELMKMKYTWQVVREAIRLFPPIFGSFRRAIQDIDFDGFIIPKGWKVLWTSYGTHNNEEHFIKPDIFDPNRFEEGVTIPPYVYVPFGGGPRVCVGYQFAKFNILIIMHFIVTNFNWHVIHQDESIRMDPLPFPCLGMPIKISPKA